MEPKRNSEPTLEEDLADALAMIEHHEEALQGLVAFLGHMFDGQHMPAHLLPTGMEGWYKGVFVRAHAEGVDALKPVDGAWAVDTATRIADAAIIEIEAPGRKAKGEA